MALSHLENDESQFVEGFYLVDAVLQHIQAHNGRYSVTGAEARLLISTCRNHFLTINGIFADVRTLLVPEAGIGRRSLLEQLRDPAVQRSQKSYKRVEGDVSVACKGAREKFAVWNRASVIMKAIESACDEFSPRRRETDAVKAILATPASSIDGEPITDPRYVELNTSRVATLQVHEHVLNRVIAYAESLLAVVKSIVDTGVAESANLLTKQQLQEDWQSFFRVAADVHSHLGGTVTDGGQTILFLNRDRTVTISAEQPRSESVRDLLAQLAAFEETLIRQIMETFPPNIAIRKLPSIFRMAFPSEQPRAGDKIVQEISTEIIDLNSGAFESFTIACPTFGMPLSFYREDIRRFTDVGREKASELLRSVLCKIAATRCCKVLLLPEYFVPESMQDEISRCCIESGCIAIYGLEARDSSREQGAVVNEAIVDFSSCDDVLPPQLRSAHGRAIVSKCFPSKFEPKLDSTRSVSIFRQTPIGSFAVVICSDLLEHNVVGAIHRCPTPLNAVFVCAMNPSPGIFEPLVRADAVRLHCPIIVASNCVDLKSKEKATWDGTGIAEPKRIRATPEVSATEKIVDGKHRILHGAHCGATDDWPSVSFTTTPEDSIENGPAGLAVYHASYSFMNDIRTSAVERSHLPVSSSNSLGSR